MPMICSGITRARKNSTDRDKHEDRDRALEKSDVDRARVVGGGVEQRVEGGEPEDAHEDVNSQRSLSCAHSATTWRPTSGSRIATTITQRRQVSTMGETWPTASRPATPLPAHIRVVRTSSR